MADIIDTLIVLAAAGITLALLSYLYRENLWFRIAEHAYIGGSAAYGALIMANNAWNFLSPYVGRGEFLWWLTIPIGLMYLFFFSNKYFYFYRYPTAIVLGIDIGTYIARSMKTQFLEQIRDTMKIENWKIGVEGVNLNLLNDLVVALGVICALFYFYSTMEHRGAFRYVSKFGIYVLMAGFGASFGTTVMARISLIIGRFRFLYFTDPAYYVLPVAGAMLLIGIVMDYRKKSAG